MEMDYRTALVSADGEWAVVKAEHLIAANCRGLVDP